MLTHLRRIRKRLIDSGASRKYLLYALGEVILVVVGILLALQINTCNQQRINTQIMKDYLTSMHEEVELDLESFHERTDYTVRRLLAVQFILRNLETPAAMIQRDSMTEALNLFTWIGGVESSASTYEDLLNTGNLRLIKPVTLRQHIQNYYRNVESARSSINTNNRVFIDNIVPFTMRYFAWNKLIKHPVREELYRMPKTRREIMALWEKGFDSPEMRELENHLSWRHVDLNGEIMRYDELIREGKSLLDRIDLVLAH